MKSIESIPFPTAAGSTSSDAANMTPPHDDLPNGANTVKGQARGADLLGRVVDTAHQTIDRLADRAAPAVGKIEDGVYGAGDALRERADQIRDVGGEWVDSMRTSVREHPVAAISIALAVGMLLARMSSR
jgi:ElaB/YqjD/DUF883 family membrane-anchored ribosome-binding protein